MKKQLDEIGIKDYNVFARLKRDLRKDKDTPAGEIFSRHENGGFILKATIDGQEVAYRSKEPYEFKYSPTKLTRMLANPIRTIMGEAPLGEDDQIERTGEAEVLTVNTESGQLYYAFAEEDDFFVVKLIPHGGNDSERLVVSSKGNLYPTNMTEAEARRALKEANSVAKDMKRRLKVEKYRLLSDSAEQLSNQTTQKSLSGKDKETLRDLARRELVESTSFYLKGVIERSLAAHEGQLDVDDIIDIINLEGKTALFMPASIFETAEELVHNYDMYFDMAMGRNKGDLKYSDRVRIAQAYLDQVENARQDGRYFGRNSLEYSAKYGSKSAASKAARKFLNQYGYELNDKAVEFSVSQRGRDPILEWGRVSQHIKPRATKDKTE